MKSVKAHLLQQTRVRQMRRARKRIEPETAMAIVPVSPRPFSSFLHISTEERMRISTLLTQKVKHFSLNLIRAQCALEKTRPKSVFKF